MKSKSDVKASRKYLFFMAGGIITSVIIFLPQILRGELTSCFQFLTDRSGFGIEKSLPESLEGYARILFYSISILLSVWMARDICKKPTENLFDKFMGYCLTVLGLCFIFPSTTQYLVVMVPFIVYHIAVKSKKFMKCWLLIGVGGSLMTYSSVTAPLLPLGFNTDFFSGHWMVETFTAVTKPIISQCLIFQSLSIYSILSFISLIIQCIGVALVLWINLDRHYRNKEEKFQ